MDMTTAELHQELTLKRDEWWKALQEGKYVWAAYYANDIEAVARRLTTITHNYVRERYADPESALGRYPHPGVQTKEGD